MKDFIIGQSIDAKTFKELKSFSEIWKGGYYEGDPLDPLSTSSFRNLGFMSILHSTYLRCIKPYVNNRTISLEIGPGRGAWTKTLLISKEVWVLDALPAEYNRFFDYLGRPSHVRYYQVKDYACSMLPENYFDFMFSFGCLCHISFENIEKYAKNLYPKMKDGANCFWMIADYGKYNAAIERYKAFNLLEAIFPRRKLLMLLPVKLLLLLFKPKPLKYDRDYEPKAGRWFHAGIDKTCSMLTKNGYAILDSDVGTSLRDPIIHFKK